MAQLRAISDTSYSKSFVGRIEEVIRHAGGELSRTTFVIDAISDNNQSQFLCEDRDIQPTELSDIDPRQFSMIRIVTTPKRVSEISGNFEIESDPGSLVEQWVSLELVPFGMDSGPVAQVASLTEAGYTDLQRFTVRAISVFGPDPEKPRSLGAAASTKKQKAAALRAMGSQFAGKSKSHHVLTRLIHALTSNSPATVRVRDVGQANFVSVESQDGKCIFHFDVGWPIEYLRKTAPSFIPSVSRTDITILSHWDWDHIHGYYVWPHLKDSFWIAPIQDLGPGALYLALGLDGRGNLLSVSNTMSSLPWASLLPQIRVDFVDSGHAVSKSHRKNNSGIFIEIQLTNGKRVLLPGDADYQGLSQLRSHYDLVVVPHHGATIVGTSPSPTKLRLSAAAVSAGLPNKYGHPDPATIAGYLSKLWKVNLTCMWLTRARGDRLLS